MIVDIPIGATFRAMVPRPCSTWRSASSRPHACSPPTPRTPSGARGKRCGCCGRAPRRRSWVPRPLPSTGVDGAAAFTATSDSPLPENTFRPDSPAFSALPTLSAEDAVARFVDGAPYVELVPLRNLQSKDKKPLLAKLVVTRARNGTSLPAWKLRFRYPCWSWGLPPTEPTRLSEREGNAYVDAHSGVVYRDGFGWGSVR